MRGVLTYLRAPIPILLVGEVPGAQHARRLRGALQATRGEHEVLGELRVGVAHAQRAVAQHRGQTHHRRRQLPAPHNLNAYASLSHTHHHQPINVPTAGAQAFLMDYPQGEQAITHHAGPVRIDGCYRLQMQPGPTA
jgi:hypothetical protein